MYILHHTPDSAALVVRLVLEELKLPYQIAPIDRAGGALDTPAYRKLHPLGKIPALETPNGVMFESAAILLHLTEVTGKLAPAPGTPHRAKFLTWLFFTSNNLHPVVMHYYYPDRLAGAQNAEAVKTQAALTAKSLLTTLNQMIATDAPAWLTTEPSALGYYIAVLMRWLAEPCPPSDYPALHNILTALETTAAALTCAQAEDLGQTIFTNPY
ncbi:MAG: glutathione S-transferase family protein [Cypionkella sp.]|uniref:glutathione S-transferase family protein n=1 Tax=Cypionkella sp. TaxID=2811411 RepID=UPI0026216245|nr:glutathione S-transferase family protein [Cypionkella sp.]MDB5658410.1 glutathione S-transferase family protein [Cypionkella sp.]